MIITHLIPLREINCLQTMKEQGVVAHSLYYCETTPCLYGLPQINKYVATIAPLVGNTCHHIQSQGLWIRFIDFHWMQRKPWCRTVWCYIFVHMRANTITAAVKAVRERLSHDHILHDQTQLSPDQVCLLLEFSLNTTYFKYYTPPCPPLWPTSTWKLWSGRC